MVLGEKKTTKEIIRYKRKNSSVYLSKEQHKHSIFLLTTAYPLENAKTASTCLQILNENSTFKNTEVHFNNGLNNIRKKQDIKQGLKYLKRIQTLFLMEDTTNKELKKASITS